jgi:hypothetical protein
LPKRETQSRAHLYNGAMRAEPLFHFKHGDHICVFYTDVPSILEILAPYIAEGLRNNERCFCAQRPDVLRALANELCRMGVDTERETTRGALELHTTSEVYLHNGRFEPARLMRLLERSIADAARAGYAGFRTAGDLAWSVEDRDECDRVVEYEKLVEASYPGKPVLGLCQYPVTSFTPDMLKRVIGTHRKSIDNAAGASAHARLSIRDEKGGAEIVADKMRAHPSYHYVAERSHGEVLGWGQTASFPAAMERIELLTARTDASLDSSLLRSR